MPVAKFFYFFYFYFYFYGEVRSKKETDQMRPEGQVSRGEGELWLSETEVKGKFTIGGRGGGLTCNALTCAT